jgi:hypothetical protein
MLALFYHNVSHFQWLEKKISFAKYTLSHLNGFESRTIPIRKGEAFAILRKLQMTGLDYRFRFAETYGVKSVKPDFSDSPPDCRI